MKNMIYLLIFGLICGQLQAQRTIRTGKANFSSFVKDKNGNAYPVLKFPYKGKDRRYKSISWLAADLKVKSGSAECYKNSSGRCYPGGLYYSNGDATRACKSLGQGWQLPKRDDWNALIGLFGKTAHLHLLKGGKSNFNAGLNGKLVANDRPDASGYLPKFRGTSGTYMSVSPGYRGTGVAVAIFHSNNVVLGTSDHRTKTTCRCVKYEY